MIVAIAIITILALIGLFLSVVVGGPEFVIPTIILWIAIFCFGTVDVNPAQAKSTVTTETAVVEINAY